jgi:anti-anti-sigma factor
MLAAEQSITRPNSPLVITIDSPQLDVWACDRLQALLEPAYANERVVIDMSAVQYIDSSCLGKLATKRRIRARKGYPPARVVAKSPQVRRVFTLVQFDCVWPLFETVAEALSEG